MARSSPPSRIGDIGDFFVNFSLDTPYIGIKTGTSFRITNSTQVTVMCKNQQRKIPLGMCKTLLAGAAACLVLLGTARAQDSNAPTTMKPVVVTGSLIPTAETVGPAPVQTIGAAD